MEKSSFRFISFSISFYDKQLLFVYELRRGWARTVGVQGQEVPPALGVPRDSALFPTSSVPVTTHLIPLVSSPSNCRSPWR